MERRNPQGANLRLGRVSIQDAVYAVTTVTYRRYPFFRELRFGRMLVQTLRTEDDLGRTRTLAFVVMPDHLHWLFQLRAGWTLERVVWDVKRASALKLPRNPPCTDRKVWQKGFYDHLVRRNEDLENQARYIIANPLRAGLVRSVGEYPLWDAVWLE